MARRGLLRAAIFLAGYFAAGRVGLDLTFVHASASPVWPPTGIAIAFLILWGIRYAPVVFIGAAAFNLLNAPALGVALRDPSHVLVSATIGFGNMMEAVVAAYVILAWCGRRPFEDASGVAKFALLAGIIAPAVSATIGVGTLVGAGFAPINNFGAIWATWWLGDAAGALLVAPLILLWAQDRKVTRPKETIAAMGVTAAFGWFAFSGLVDIWLSFVATVAMLVVIVWPAIRLGARESATAAAVAATAVVVGTLQGHGPFSILGPNASLLLVQLSIVFVALAALIVSVPFRVGEQPLRIRSPTAIIGTLLIISPLVLGIAGAALVTMSFAQDLQSQRYEAEQSAFERSLDDAIDVQGDRLQALSAAFVAVDGLERSEFHIYIEEAGWVGPTTGTNAVAFVAAVPESERAAFGEQENADMVARSIGYPDFEMHPSNSEPMHYIVQYIAPIQGNEAAYGLDIAVENARMQAVEESIQTRSAVMTAPLQLVQSSGESVGLLMLYPVIIEGHVVGMVDSVHSADFLIAAAGDGGGARVSVVDIGRAGLPMSASALENGTVLYGSLEPGAPWRSMDVGGRTWAVAVEEQNLLSTTEQGAPWFMMIAGAALAALLASVAYLNATSLQRVQELVLQRTDALERSNKDLEQFAFAASHDLRQPLEAVSGYLLEAELSEGDAQRENIKSARASIGRMRRLLQDLLNYARTGTEMKFQQIDLQAFFDEIMADFPGAPITLNVSGSVHGDRALLHALFRNLVDNGLKFQPEGRTPEIHVDAKRGARGMAITVQDNGVGIPAGARDDIFALFRRLHTRDEYEGTGLGLAQVKRIADLHAATIVVGDAQPGTRITIQFPYES